jgi:hypothetical protein
MALTLWGPKQLLQRLRDDRMDAVPSYFLDTYFKGRFYSEDKDILIRELPAAGRKLAPFVLPTEQGKPIAEFKGETHKALTPPYIKPKDAVRAVDARDPLPDEVWDGPKSLQQRFNWRVGEIQDQHRRAILMRIAYMAAKATTDGKITVRYDRDQGAAFPEVTIDFGRASNQTVVLTGPTYWDDVDYPILDDVELWANRMNQAKYGQAPNVLLVGASVAPLFRKNKQVRAEMDMTVRGNSVNIPTGIQVLNVQGLTYIGSLSGGIEVWSYRDYVEAPNGDLVDLLDPKDVLLIAPGNEGVVAFGAIYNAKANQAGQVSTDIFPSMWLTDDPSDIFLMHESSPLPIPLFPNRVLKATVLA